MGLNLIETNHYEVIITDVNMPRMDGYELCSTLRDRSLSIPCLMLTARDQLEDKLEGFAKGADDYLVKPFELAELVARIKVMMRRNCQPGQLLQVADLSMNMETKAVSRAGKSLNLSPTEWALLECLIRHSPAIVSKQKIEAWVWKDEEPSNDAFKMLLYRLRRIVDGESNKPLIVTVRGQGVALRESQSTSGS